MYGTATSTSTHSDARTEAISARRVSMPNPVRADTKTSPATAGAACCASFAASVTQVCLVVRHESRLVAGTQLVEDGLDRRAMLGHMGIRGVDHLDQDVGAIDLLERGPEGLHELVRELVDEPDGVRHDRRLAVTELHLPAGGIEGGEEHVLGARDFRTDERVEQRGLARVRVADDTYGRPQPTIATPGRRLALLADALDAFLHLADPGPDDPAVRLELALAGAAGPDAAAGPRQVGPQLRQARELILELGELHLQPSLVGLGVHGEDVEDQPAAVDDLDLEQLLECALLRGRQLVVGDEDIEPGLPLGRCEVLGLALADIPVRVDVPTVLPFGAHDVTARGRREGGEFGQRLLGGPAVVGAGIHGDEEHLLDGDFEFDEG